MRENTLRNAPLDGLSITLTWSIPENPPSQGPEDFFSNYQLRFKDSQPDSSIICIVKNDGWSTGDYPYSYQLQNEREGISFDLDVDRFRFPANRDSIWHQTTDTRGNRTTAAGRPSWISWT